MKLRPLSLRYDSRTLHGGGATAARAGAERALLAITFVNPRAPPPAHEGDLTVFYEATMREGYVGRVTLGDLIAAARDPDDTATEDAFGEYGEGLGGAG